ncbi:lysozyme [Salinicola endophyticus]|uniref:Lysozyme n=1 Tax=Salinicola endophyticus TaxID=1949083 RepID=A0ABY8FD65_9GAMM|nr:lysozyme [Salinicola endophyticus]WFF40753.1 lysozyme [Salinicola endophyticus]
MSPLARWIGGSAIGGACALALSISIQVVKQFEGTQLTAYPDPVGVPTICTGHTGAEVTLGQTLTPADCEALLAGDLGHAFAVVDAALTPAAQATLTPARRAALASFVFNVGEGAFRDSTLLTRLNAGEIRAACDELARWVYADGRRLPGLVRRREAERELCLAGLDG